MHCRPCETPSGTRGRTGPRDPLFERSEIINRYKDKQVREIVEAINVARAGNKRVCVTSLAPSSEQLAFVNPLAINTRLCSINLYCQSFVHFSLIVAAYIYTRQTQAIKS